jgi:hypothetical protein
MCVAHNLCCLVKAIFTTVRERRGRREQRPDRAGCMMVVLWAPASTGSTSADPVGLI